MNDLLSIIDTATNGYRIQATITIILPREEATMLAVSNAHEAAMTGVKTFIDTLNILMPPSENAIVASNIERMGFVN